MLIHWYASDWPTVARGENMVCGHFKAHSNPLRFLIGFKQLSKAFIIDSGITVGPGVKNGSDIIVTVWAGDSPANVVEIDATKMYNLQLKLLLFSPEGLVFWKKRTRRFYSGLWTPNSTSAQCDRESFLKQMRFSVQQIDGSFPFCVSFIRELTYVCAVLLSQHCQPSEVSPARCLLPTFFSANLNITRVEGRVTHSWFPVFCSYKNLLKWVNLAVCKACHFNESCSLKTSLIFVHPSFLTKALALLTHCKGSDFLVICVLPYHSMTSVAVWSHQSQQLWDKRMDIRIG